MQETGQEGSHRGKRLQVAVFNGVPISATDVGRAWLRERTGADVREFLSLAGS